MASSGEAHPLSLDRRQALLVLLGLPVALTGCTSNKTPALEPGAEESGPALTRSAATTSTATTTPVLGTSQAAAIELAMADLAGATLTGRQHRQLTSDQQALLAAVRAAHLDHVEALRSPDPTSRPTPSDTTSPQPGTRPPKRALSALVKQERAAAAIHAQTALASTGFMSLLWGSMSVAATSYASALADHKAVPIASQARRQLPALSETDAVIELLSQIHALIYGYQLAIGRLPVMSNDHGRAVAELKRIRILRDRLIAILTSRSAEVPVAQAAYVPSVRVHNAASAALLIRRMQSALLPHCGLFLAAAGKESVRKLALDTLAGSAATASSWGAPLTAWPGWS